VRHHRQVQHPREDGQARLARHYAHAVLRLRHRYGLDMTMQEYLVLSEDAKAGRGQGLLVDDTGARDIWLHFKGRWICAAMKPGAKTISTFLPPPPAMPQKAQAVPTPAPAANEPPPPPKAPRNHVMTSEEVARLASLRNEGDGLRRQIGQLQVLLAQSDRVEAELREKDEGRIAEIAQLSAVCRRYKGQTVLLKQGCQAAVSLLAKGALCEAAALMDGLASMPRDADPETWQPDPERQMHIGGWRAEAREP